MGHGHPSIWRERDTYASRVTGRVRGDICKKTLGSGDVNVELGNAKSRAQVRHCLSPRRMQFAVVGRLVGITVAGIWSFGHFSHFKGRSEVRDLAWPWPGPLPEGH